MASILDDVLAGHAAATALPSGDAKLKRSASRGVAAADNNNSGRKAMKLPDMRLVGAPVLKAAFMASAFMAGAAMLTMSLGSAAQAQSKDPIRIGVIAEAQAVAGSSIPMGAQLAADEINAAGGVDGRKIEIVSYDNHSSSAESVRAFQRAVN